MRVTLDLPDEISAALEGQWQDIPRQAFEALAVEGYRTGALTENQVRRLLDRVTANEIAPIVEGVDLGERAAIALAERVRADLILIDETEGRAEAVRRSFRVTGTPGILRAAAEEGLIDVREVVNRLGANELLR